MDWIFPLAFVGLLAAQLIFCRQDSLFLGAFAQPLRDLDPDARREFGRFMRSRDGVPGSLVATAAVRWAQAEMRQASCRWNSYVNWLLVLGITAGLVTAVAVGNTRQVAVRLVIFDLMMLAAYQARSSRRRARAVLASGGVAPG